MNVRPERPSDAEAIRLVHCAAFGRSSEADLVDLLRRDAEPVISLVAEHAGSVVGHILFSPASLADQDLKIMGLAPMGVVPAWQRQGVGSALVRTGLDACVDLGINAVVVLGHSEYYPRFGFVPASRHGLTSQYDVPDDAFMALELTPQILSGKAGTIRYHPAFARA